MNRRLLYYINVKLLKLITIPQLYQRISIPLEYLGIKDHDVANFLLDG